MATRSRIAVELEGGKVLSVYCHNDGYVSGVGNQLMSKFRNGTDSKEVEDWIRKGDRSTTDLSYAEWRGENCPPKNHKSVPAFFGSDIEEYGYLYTAEGEWLVKKESGTNGVVPLADVLSGSVNP